MKQPSQPADPVEPKLGMWDAVSIIIGIVVGTSIFKTTQVICNSVSGLWETLAVWALGGLLALVGALCYAELATTYPRSGGDYVYLTRAFGRWVGFLFGWAQLAVVLTSSIAMMAFAFADYAAPLFVSVEQGPTEQAASEAQAARAALIPWLAIGAIVALTTINLLGVLFGKVTQNLLTVAKVIGLGAVIGAGLSLGTGENLSVVADSPFPNFGLAMILVLYAYGGWNDAAFIAAEVRDQKRNLPRALILGILGITVIYLLVNAAYIWGLGFEGVRKSSEPAADVLHLLIGPWASKGMRVLVMVSALGAINGLIFAGSRVYLSLGKDHRLFALLGRWNERLGSPIWSLLAQMGFAIFFVLSVGTEKGRAEIDGLLGRALLDPLPWTKYFGGFETLLAATAPVFWMFFLLTGVALIRLRDQDQGIERPFSVPLYPLVPLVFIGTCVYMLYSSISYASHLTLLGAIPLVVGLPLYWISCLLGKPDAR